MIFQKTDLENVWVISPQLKKDARGFFTRTFCQKEFQEHNIQFNIIQINITLTKKKGSIRGLHFQKEPYSEDKIVQCLRGNIYDVAVDIRKDAPTYGKWITQELNEDNRKMFYIPKGFAHGFQTLEDNCEIQYFMSEFYSPDHSSGFRYNDPFFNIKWPLDITDISDKDKNWPLIKKVL